MKIAVIGGGSTYTPELVNGFLERMGSLPLTELCLMDIDQARLEVVGGFARRMVAAHGDPFTVTLTGDQQKAVQGCSYVITQLRVGQMPARVADEYLGRRHGLVGQETTGVGGMAKALRTIPVILKLTEDMRQLAPDALLVNFTNPSGMVSEALSRYASDISFVGVCNSPIGMKMDLVKQMEAAGGMHIPLEKVELQALGLNHLSWYRGLKIDGEEVWSQVLRMTVERLKTENDSEWEADLVESLGMIPNYYLQYYYHTKRQLEEQEKWPPSRGETVMQIEKDLLRMYSDPNLSAPPPELMQRGGAWYSTLATQLINSHFNDLGEVHILSTRQAGEVPGWPADWVLEMPARVNKSGIHPLPAEPLPPACFGLLAQVKAYELLTVEAAVHGDRKAAYQALLTHPLGPSSDQVQAVLDDMLLTHRVFLPQFFTREAG